MAANLYVHFPFCRSRCSYCSLYSRVGASPADRVAYVARIADAITQTSKSASTQTLSTLYFGGGSPALCDLTPLKDALAPLLDENTEFTVELHPLDVTPAKLDGLKSIGVNRISMGVQSLDDDILRAMGRGYTASDAARAFALVKSRFDNAGIDLIIGYPGEREMGNISPERSERRRRLNAGWERGTGLDALKSWGLAHCSAYSLQNERGLKDVPDDDIVLDRIRTVAAFLKTLGLERYEISNYARPGFECRHNFAVWRGEDYIGLGDGAYGREGLKRTRGILQNSVNGERGTGNVSPERSEPRKRSLEGWEPGTGNGERGGNRLIAYKTTEVSPLEDLKERTLFRLRTRDGIDSSQFPEWRPTLDRFVNEGLLTHTPLVGAHLRGARGHLGEMPLPSESIYYLTERGTEVCDAILEELV